MKQLLFCAGLSLLSVIFVACDELLGPANSSAPAASENTIDSTGTGMKVKRRADGTLASKIPYVNKRKHGTGQSFYPSGKMQLEIPYRAGKKHGLEKYFYESGKLYRATLFRDGIMDSTQVFYHKNGKLMATVPYSYGRLCVGTEEFKDDGKQLSTPEIEVAIDNQVPVTGKYIFELSLSRRMKTVEYFSVGDPASLPCPQVLFPIENVSGKKRFTIDVPRGTFYMNEQVFMAECSSFQRVKHKVSKRIAVSVSNR